MMRLHLAGLSLVVPSDVAMLPFNLTLTCDTPREMAELSARLFQSARFCLDRARQIAEPKRRSLWIATARSEHRMAKLYRQMGR